MAYDSYLKRIFGDAKVAQLNSSKVLLVGAGGIGCELLKDLIMMNYGEIHVLDLDQIDLSNLNRQFLFRQHDIKKSKSLTAIKAVESFNHGTKLVAWHGNIMDTKMFPLSFFQQFDIIFNALDNLEARYYMNKISLFTKIPLMESGTTGLKGQVQPIYPYKTECFECVPKETPKTFPVCTIRSTPSKPIHCITWAKNFLLPQLLGETDDESNGDLQPTEADSDDKKELEALLKETNELLELSKLISSSDPKNPDDIDFAYKIIDKLFNEDIVRLLSIETLWSSRSKPTPLDYKVILSEEEEDSTPSDQKPLTPKQNLQLLVSTIKSLSSRPRPIEFDKDDDETLDFVLAASNLRSIVFGIPLKSKFETKQIAGNIIPAVATTNAIMAGFSALSSIHIPDVEKGRMTFDSGGNSTSRFVNSSKLEPPNPYCRACSVTRGIIKININNTKLSELKNAFVEKYGYEDDISIVSGSGGLIYDYDFDDNLDSVVGKFVSDGDVLLIGDSEELLDTVQCYIVQTESDELELPDMKIPKYKKVDNSENTEE
ncbi:hypothetical protein CANARDRAFT_191365, partial [[Candida] arabinofermentans NRRL YB-2248]